MRSSDGKMIEELTDFASKNHYRLSQEIAGVLFDTIMNVSISNIPFVEII